MIGKVQIESINYRQFCARVRKLLPGQNKDQPTPPAEPHADAGKMVAVGEGRECDEIGVPIGLREMTISQEAVDQIDRIMREPSRLDIVPKRIESVGEGRALPDAPGLWTRGDKFALIGVRASGILSAECWTVGGVRGPTLGWWDVDSSDFPRGNWHPTTADTERLRAVEAWIRSRHNGYAPEARKAMDLKEPGSLIEAMEQLEQEHEQLFSAAVEAQVAAEAELTTLREQLAAAERERDAAEAKSKPRYYVMDSLGKHWLVRDVPSWDRSLLHEDGEWSNGGAYRAVSGLKYFDSKEAAEAEITRIQSEAASAKGGA